MSELAPQLMDRYRRKAGVRLVAVLCMWLFAAIAFLFGVIERNHIIGVTVSVGIAIFPLLPMYAIYKRYMSVRLERVLNEASHITQIAAYTSLIYFLGGIEATYLLPIYAAVIVYEGILSRRGFAFFSAFLSSILFGTMVLFEYLGIIPHHTVVARPDMPPVNQLFIVLVVIGLLFVVAILTSNTAVLLKNKNRQLEMALEQIREADRTKSQFLANMSHELRTPLNHIIGFTDLVLGKQLGSLNESQEEYLSDVRDSSGHLLALINDLLDLSKIEAGKLELNLSDVNFHELVRNSMNMVSERAAKHHIDTSLDMSDTPELIYADSRKLKQIMYNLLSNAVKFTPDNGSVRVFARLVRDADDSSEKHVAVSVIDTGVGFSAEDQHKLFEPFEQLAAANGQEREGTGLGLSYTKRLVELHGGQLQASSDGVGKGSMFTFSFPSRDTPISDGPTEVHGF